MPTRRKSPLGMLYARVSGRTRAWTAAAAVLGFGAKLAIVMTALEVSSGDARAAAFMGVAVGVFLAAQRVVGGAARVGAECDIYRAACRAMLEADVLSVPGASPLRTVFESGSYARLLLADTLPELAANALAALAVVPILVHELPARVLVLAAVALGVVMVGALAVRRMTVAFQERVSAVQEDVMERTSAAVDGRLELVARGGEEAFLRSLDLAIGRYHRVVNRAALASAFVGRAPIAAGAATMALVVLIDGSSRDAVASVVFAKALLLASALPVVLGTVLGASELVRSIARVRPLVELLAAPPRPELARGGKAAPTPLAPLAFDGVGFGYKEGEPPILRDVTFEWPAGRALVLEGPNGAGKSTVLRLMLGLRAPSAGTVRIGGADLDALDPRALRRDIGYLPQRPYLGEPYLTVRASARLVDPEAADEAITSALERVVLLPALRARGSDPLDVSVGELSAGQRQRLALARVLLRGGRVLLLDEPDANLDRAGVALVAAIVRELVAEGVMVAIAAHTPELAEVSTLRVSLD